MDLRFDNDVRLNSWFWASHPVTQKRYVVHNYRISMIFICNSFVLTQSARPLTDFSSKIKFSDKKSSHAHRRGHSEKSLLNRINILFFSSRWNDLFDFFSSILNPYMRIINFIFFLLICWWISVRSENERKIFVDWLTVVELLMNSVLYLQQR